MFSIPYCTQEKSRLCATGGTGLNFTMAQQLIEAKNGMIEAKSLPEGGLQGMIEFEKIKTRLLQDGSVG
jgi:K+-sensing histidine kinase KdpD